MSPCLLVSLSPCLSALPRGPGFYNPAKLVTVVCLYLLVVKTCAWVDRDARALKLPAAWSGLVLGCGALGLLAAWFLPWFFLGLLVFTGLYLGSGLVYAHSRDQKAPPGRRLLGGWFPGGKVGRKEQREEGTPVRFSGKGLNPQVDEPGRLARAEGPEVLQAAKELIYEAVRGRATTVRLEPERTRVVVRLQIDGLFRDGAPLERPVGAGVIQVFKGLSNLDPDEKRKPQEGGFSALVQERVVNFQVSTSGTIAGEKMTLRVLTPEEDVPGLARLGMAGKMAEQVRRMVNRPAGLLAVCGPAEAGKTTTLHALLGEVDRFRKHVVALEGRTETRLENVTRVEVGAGSGKTYASELTALVKQAPDVVLVGAVGDRETAVAAFQAAQAGALVATAVEARDAVAGLGRLLGLGVPPALVAGTLRAVLAQRLVRLLCPECKVRYKPDPDVLRKANLPADRTEYLYRPPKAPAAGEKGRAGACEHCGGTGYRGRTGIFELLIVSDRIRELILQKAGSDAVRQEAVKEGMRPLQEDGLRLVLEGKTAIQELARILR